MFFIVENGLTEAISENFEMNNSYISDNDQNLHQFAPVKLEKIAVTQNNNNDCNTNEKSNNEANYFPAANDDEVVLPSSTFFASRALPRKNGIQNHQSEDDDVLVVLTINENNNNRNSSFLLQNNSTTTTNTNTSDDVAICLGQASVDHLDQNNTTGSETEKNSGLIINNMMMKPDRKSVV